MQGPFAWSPKDAQAPASYSNAPLFTVLPRPAYDCWHDLHVLLACIFTLFKHCNVYTNHIKFNEFQTVGFSGSVPNLTYVELLRENARRRTRFFVSGAVRPPPHLFHSFSCVGSHHTPSL